MTDAEKAFKIYSERCKSQPDLITRQHRPSEWPPKSEKLTLEGFIRDGNKVIERLERQCANPNAP